MKNIVGWMCIAIGTIVLWNLAISEKSVLIGIFACLGTTIILNELNHGMFYSKHPHQKNKSRYLK